MSQIKDNNHNVENTAELLTGSGKRGRSMRIALVVVGVFVALAVLLAVFIINETKDADENGLNNETTLESEKVINLADLMEVELSGINGKAVIDNINVWTSDSTARELEIDDEDFEKLVSSVHYTANKRKRLSNGDVIRVKAKYDKKMADELGVTIVGKKFVFTVQDLIDEKDVIGSWDYYGTLFQAAYDTFIPWSPEWDPYFDGSSVVISNDGRVTIAMDGYVSEGKWKEDADCNIRYNYYNGSSRTHIYIEINDEEVTGKIPGNEKYDYDKDKVSSISLVEAAHVFDSMIKKEELLEDEEKMICVKFRANIKGFFHYYRRKS